VICWAWVGRAGQLTRARIEGAANLCAGLARLLHQQGLAVREVPCTLTVRERRRLRRPGKSDPTDALAIARITAREDDLPPARHAGQAEDLKVLSDYRDELVASAPPRPTGCTRSGDRVPWLRAALPGACLSPRAQHSRIQRLRQLDEQIAACLTQLTKLVAATRTQLVDIVGIGPLLAARILGEVGDIQRFPTRDHFASANGTAPIPVSSGRTDRYRLNRGGNRRLNRALYFAAFTHASHDPQRAPPWPVSRPRARPAGKPALSEAPPVRCRLQGAAGRAETPQQAYESL
jgi:transposase